jgi:hypothetical protein
METRQARYKKTRQGKQKQAEAQQRYLEATESWQSLIPVELSDRVKAAMPVGVSKSQLIKQLLIKFVEKDPDTP